MPSSATPPRPPQPPLEPGTGSDADEREFDTFAQEQDPLDIEAATWATRRRSGLDAQGEAQLQAWLDADARHAEALADMEATFGDVQRLPDDDVARLRAALPAHGDPAGTVAALPATGAPPRPWPGQPTPGHRPWPARLAGRTGTALAGALRGLRPLAPQATAAAIAFTAVGAGWMGWDHWRRQPVFEQSLATLRGQQLTATLPDAQAHAGGSTVQLDTATRTEVRLYRDRREVRLQDGQAMFVVHADADRPFHVHAGALRITVVGTRFSVRHTSTGQDAGQTVVTVEEGRVRVAPTVGALATQAPGASDAAISPPAVELNAGQTVVADAQGHIGTVASLPAGAVAPWRDGRLNFDQTPLAQAIAEFERYGRTGLVVRDPAVAALPVGGSYSLGQFQRFAETLPQVLPVRLERRGEVTEVVAR